MRPIFLVILLILIASFFRFYNLEKTGPIFYDEGQYIAEAIYVKDILVWSGKFITKLPFSAEKAKFIDISVHSFQSLGEEAKTGRPIHNLVMALGTLIIPISQNWGNYVMASFGILNIGLTFILTLVLTKSKKTSLLAAIFLSLLPLHIFYSRLVMAEMDSQFFFLISLILYIKRIQTNKLIYWYLTSTFISIALITNGDRIAFLTPIVTEIIYYRLRALKSLIIFAIAFIFSIILVEIPYHIAFLLTHNYNLYIPNPTYIEQQLWIYTRLSNFGTKLNLLSLLSYPYMLISTTGYLFFTFIIIGFIKSLKLKDKLNNVILICLSLTLLFQSIHSLQALRAISAILPLLTIEAAIGILFVIKVLETKIKNKNLLTIFSLLLVSTTILELFINSLPILNYISPYQNLSIFLNNNQAKSLVTTNDIVIKNFIPNVKTINYQNTLGVNNFSKFESEQPNFIITTIQKYTILTKAINLSSDLDPITKSIEANCQPVFSVTNLNSSILLKLFAFEHNSKLNQTHQFIEKYKNQKDQLQVYNFKECIKKISFH